MPGGGQPAGDQFITHTVEFGTGEPDRLVSGFVTVNVRNKAAKDVNQQYFRGWSENPNDIPSNGGAPPEGGFPFYEDAALTSPPAYPTDNIFEFGVGGDTETDTALRQNNTGRRFHVTNPGTVSVQKTRVTCGTGADTAHGSYFIVPAKPSMDETDPGFPDPTELNNGKFAIWFYDTAVGDSEAGPALGDIGEKIRVDYSSTSATSASGMAGLVNVAVTSYEDNLEHAPFTGSYAAGEFCNIWDTEKMRRPDAYTDIGTMLDEGTNAENGTFTPTAWRIVTAVKGTKTGFNAEEVHATTNDGTTGNDPNTGTYTCLPAMERPYKRLGVGDYDCFLFFVTCAAHIDSTNYRSNNEYHDYTGWAVLNGANPDLGAVPYSKGGNSIQYHHHACQSFIKSHLISRINNAHDCDRFTGTDTIDDDHSTWRRGQERNTYYFDDDPAANAWGGRRDDLDFSKDYLFNHGRFKYGRNIGGVDIDGTGDPGEINEDDYRFGIDLSEKHTGGAAFPDGTVGDTGRGSNNFYTPVRSIDIRCAHATGEFFDLTGATHPATFGLAVDVHLWAYDNQHGSSLPHVEDVICNIFWQPFGETTKFAVKPS